MIALPHKYVRHDFGEAVIECLQDFVALREIEFSLLQVDETIHHLVLHAGEIIRSLLKGCRRIPAGFRIAEAACAPVHPIQIKVGIVQALAERALRHLFDSSDDTHLFQVFLEQRKVTQVFLTRDKVDGERLAVLFEHALRIHLVTRFRKESASTIRVELVERCRRILVAFPQVGVIAVEQEVLVVHVLFVHRFTVQEHIEGAAHADILELRLAQVDGHALETNRFLVEDTLLDRPALLNGVEVGLFHPDAAGINGVGIDVLLLERFERLRLVVHKTVADLFEVVLAAVPVLLEAPPVSTALQFHVAVFAEGLDLVRTGHHRKFVADLVEVLPRPRMLREGEHARRFPEVTPMRFLGGHLDGQTIHDFGAVESA